MATWEFNLMKLLSSKTETTDGVTSHTFTSLKRASHVCFLDITFGIIFIRYVYNYKAIK